MNSNIAIIGGADGPTAIYVAGKFNPFVISICAVALAVSLFAIYHVRKKRNKK